MGLKLPQVSGLGTTRAELPDGTVIRYDAEAEAEVAVYIERLVRGVRSACARCREQSAPGSRFCEEHSKEVEWR
jgi:hypothetical protein